MVFDGVNVRLGLLEPLITGGDADLPNAGDGVVPNADCNGCGC